MKRGLRAQLGLYDDTMDYEEVECPNCGKIHLKRRVLVLAARGNGKSQRTLVELRGFCDVGCMLEYDKKNGIGW